MEARVPPSSSVILPEVMHVTSFESESLDSRCLESKLLVESRYPLSLDSCLLVFEVSGVFPSMLNQKVLCVILLLILSTWILFHIGCFLHCSKEDAAFVLVAVLTEGRRVLNQSV